MNSLEKEALSYLERGLSIIPVGKDKHPLLPAWKEFQARRPTPEEVKNWFATYHHIDGIAIVTGAISNIVVLDVEVDGDITGLDIPRTPTTKTGGGGRHYYFKHPGFQVKNSAGELRLKIDVRGDGGYVVAPPSTSSKGAYEWITDLETPFAPMPEWMIVKKPSVPIEAPHTPPAADAVPPTNTKPIVPDNTWAGITRGVEEGRRHNSALRIVGKLLHHLPHKDRDSIVLPMLEAWNTQNIPPLEDDELRKIYYDIRAQREKDEAVTEIPAKEREPLSVAELLAYLPTTEPFLISPLVPHRGITALGGQPGVGKSWIMLEIAKAVAKGEPLFGRFPTLQGSVLIVDEEGGMDEMWKRVKMLSFSEDLPIFFHIVRGLKLDKEKDLAQLLAEVEERDISLVIFDPYIGIHNKSENSAEETAIVMEALQKFVEAGAAVLYIHHLRKDSIAKFGLGQALRGSSVLLGRLDSLIVAKNVGSEGGSTEIQIHHEKARRGRKVDPFQLTLFEENDKMSVINLANVEPVKLKVEQAKDAIIEMLADGGEMSRADIIATVRTGIAIGDKNISNALLALVEDKKITEVRHGREKYYQLVPNSGREVIHI